MSIAKHTGRALLMLVALVAMFWVGLTTVYLIPQSALEQNGMSSARIIVDEGLYPISLVTGKSMDNWMQAIMVGTALEGGGNPFVDALAGARLSAAGEDPVSALEAQLDDADDMIEVQYSRYWHGYLLYLKPLLCFFDIYQIRIALQMAFLLALALAVAFLVRVDKDGGGYAAFALVVSYLLFGSVNAVPDLPMAPSFVISVFGVIWAAQVRFDLRLITRGFLLLGAFTVFFDFLDNPILTLGMPLCVLVWRFCETNYADRMIKAVCASLLCWFFAYGFVWFSKWVLASLVLGENVAWNGFDAALLRLGVRDQSAYTEGLIAFESIKRNIMRSSTDILLILSLLLVLFSVAARSIIYGRRSLREKNLGVALFFVVGILPYVWYAIMSNHSFEHHWFTYRDQIITLFALLLIVRHVLQGFSRNRHASEDGTFGSEVDLTPPAKQASLNGRDMEGI